MSAFADEKENATQAEASAKNARSLRQSTLQYAEKLRESNAPYGRYRFSASMSQSVLYGSTYAAMLRSLFDDLASISKSQRDEWIDYLSAHQDEDGLFRDPLIYDQGWYAGDPLWCGRSHLSCHVIVALTCLEARPRRSFRWLDQFLGAGQIESWLAERDWSDRPAWVGNEVMNVGTLLQYERDQFANRHAGEALQRLLKWLDHNWLNSGTGLWGGLDARDAVDLSQLVQAAYHLWPLYTYDHREIPLVEQAVDSVLRTQNPLGGFGWGVHNPASPWQGSACEDIDSIEPLVRFIGRSDYRRDAMVSALEKAVPWVLSNQNPDGGFVFVRDRPLDYGHPILQAAANESSLFPTWFRTLSLAYLGQILPKTIPGRIRWQFCQCPGYQFWN